MDWNVELKNATDAFARCLAEGDLAAPVPACPSWSLADLGNHLRGIHLWAAHAVTEGNPDGTFEPVAPEQLVDAYRDAAGHLLAVLGSTGPGAPVWTFGADTTVGFWWRRQTHETVVHVYDALAADGREARWEIAPELAWDGVDEVATVFYPRQVRLGRIEPLAGTLRLRASDADGAVEIGEREPVADLTGSAAELLLTLWRRQPAADPVAARLLKTAITP